MEVIYCKRCHECKRTGYSFETASLKICQIIGMEPIDLCNSYCGPGEYKQFLTIDDEIFEADTFELLIKRLGEK